MKQFIKYDSDNYCEIISVDDEAAEMNGVEISIPDGFRPLVKLEDNRPDPENPLYIKLILLEDKVLFKLMANHDEVSTGNIRILPLRECTYFGFGMDTDTLTDEYQEAIKDMLQDLFSEKVQNAYQKALSIIDKVRTEMQ